MTTNQHKFNAAGIYIYAGGFTYGVQKHLNVAHHFEDPKPYAQATARRNVGVDVHAHPWTLLDNSGNCPFDAIFCNPPCCAFSAMGRALTGGREAWRTHPALECTRNVFAALETTQVPILAWESVINSLHHGHEFIAGFAERANEMGYSFTMVPHNAYYMGSAQNRTRIMYIVHRIELGLAEPDYTRTESALDRIAQFSDNPGPAIYDSKWEEKYGYLIPSTKVGTTLRTTFNEMHGDNVNTNARGHVIGRPAVSGPYRLYPDKPSHVVCGFPFVHPVEDRMLGLYEMSALADFPPDWVWPDNMNGVTNEMARGVSSYVGEWLGASLDYSLTQNEAIAEPELHWHDLRYPPDKRKDIYHYFKQKNINPATFGL